MNIPHFYGSRLNAIDPQHTVNVTNAVELATRRFSFSTAHPPLVPVGSLTCAAPANPNQCYPTFGRDFEGMALSIALTGAP